LAAGFLGGYVSLGEARLLALGGVIGSGALIYFGLTGRWRELLQGRNDARSES
jgi:hypothetical protein